MEDEVLPLLLLFFTLGLHSGEGASQVQEELLQESQDLTVKTTVMLEQLDTYCSYALKINSDVFLNVANVINFVPCS